MDDKEDSSAVRAVRIAALANALLWAVLGVGWNAGANWAVALWPWPEVPMTFVFLASIAAAIAVVWLTIAVSGEMAPLAGVGLNIVIAAACTAAHLWTQGLLAFAGLALASLVIGIALLAWASRQPVHDARAMPGFVRLAFAVFTCVLVTAGGALVWQVQVFPWLLHPSTMVIVGAIFLGAAGYFVHAAWQRCWVYAAPPLWGFLAYDLVLFAPYIKLLGDGSAVVDDYGGSSVNMTSLTVYLVVLAASTVVALACLFVYPTTRLFGRRSLPVRP